MENVSLPSSVNLSDPDIEDCHYLQGVVWKKIYLSKHAYRNLLALICLNSLAIIPTILLNGLVIFVVATRRRLQTNSNILLACLAGTDFLVGLVAQPIAIAVKVERAFSIEPFCLLETVFTIILYATGCTSLGHLVLISIDRFFATKDALRYWEIVTKQRIKNGVLVVWAITMVLTIQETVLAVINSGTKGYIVYCTLAGVMCVIIGFVYIAGICYCYVYIFSETRRQKKRLQTEQLPQEEAKRVKKGNKAANTLALILGALIVTYLPIIILILVVAFSTLNLQSSE